MASITPEQDKLLKALAKRREDAQSPRTIPKLSVVSVDDEAPVQLEQLPARPRFVRSSSEQQQQSSSSPDDMENVVHGMRRSSISGEPSRDTAYKHLTAAEIRKADGLFKESYADPAQRLPIDADDDDEEYDSTDSDESDSSSAVDSSDSEGSEIEWLAGLTSGKGDDSFLGDYQSDGERKFRVKSHMDVDSIRNTKRSQYLRKVIHPTTAFDDKEAPYTSDTEELADAKHAALLEIEISQIQSNNNTKRMLRTMERGDVPPLAELLGPPVKSYLVASDLSPEAAHALEWTIGTVIRDGNLLMIVCTFEDDGSQNDLAQESERLMAMDRLTQLTVKLLKRTRLQVHVVIEVLHCKIPRHVLTEIIDHVAPTLVILGSRGRSALKGILLGSFSNYVVEKSSVPVMVARRKLHKAKNKGLNVTLANNLRAHRSPEPIITE
jgi:nucleotide-binding universal stress UspA family protein